MFRRLIASMPRACDLGEVFHTNTHQSNNFWGFLRDEAIARPACMHPAHWPGVWRDFLRTQSERHGADTIVFDLKSQYLPLLSRTNADPLSFFIHDEALTYIYLHRRNTAAQVVSHQVAAATQVWGMPIQDVTEFDGAVVTADRPAAASGPPRRILANPFKVMEEIRRIQHEEDFVLRQIRGRLSAVFVYEDLFDADGRFTSATVAQLAELTGRAPESFERRPAMRRQRRASFLDSVANRADFLHAFRGTDLEWMLDD